MSKYELLPIPYSKLDGIVEGSYAAEAIGRWGVDAIANYQRQRREDGYALRRFHECGGADEKDPIERLRFFCSFATGGQDWLDLESFIADVIADREEQRQAPPANLGGSDAAVAAIAFALEADDGMEWLRYWNEGEFDICRKRWPDSPPECFIGADPMLPETKEWLALKSAAHNAMPDALPDPSHSVTDSGERIAEREGYVSGWNECREAMALALQQKL